MHSLHLRTAMRSSPAWLGMRKQNQHPGHQRKQPSDERNGFFPSSHSAPGRPKRPT